MKKTGMVKATSQKDNMYFFLMDSEDAPLVNMKKEAWYSGFGKSPDKFSTITFNWQWNDEAEKKYRNVQGEYEVITPSDKPEKLPSKDLEAFGNFPSDSRAKAIKFMNECIEDTFKVYNGIFQQDRLNISLNDLLELVVKYRIHQNISEERKS